MPYQITRYQYLVKAVRNHGDSNACLIWPFATHRQGYGWLKVDKKVMLAHRVAYFVRYGTYPIPAGLHSCDTPACFNPVHINPGTQARNVQDRDERGRGNPLTGQCHPSTKLSDEQVRTIRATYVTSRVTHRKLAAMFGVSYGHIGAILRNRWRKGKSQGPVSPLTPP